MDGGDIGKPERGVGQEVEDVGSIEDAEELEDKASGYAAVTILTHHLHTLLLGVLLDDLPITLMDGDRKGCRGFLNLVSVGGKSGRVEIVNLGNRSESNELDDNIDGLRLRAKVDNASDLGGEPTHRLHECDGEGGSWVGEVEGLVGHILHHLEALAEIALNLEMHEDGADKTSAENIYVGGY